MISSRVFDDDGQTIIEVEHRENGATTVVDARGHSLASVPMLPEGKNYGSHLGGVKTYFEDNAGDTLGTVISEIVDGCPVIHVYADDNSLRPNVMFHKFDPAAQRYTVHKVVERGDVV